MVGCSTIRPKGIVRHEDAHGNIGEPQEGDEAPPWSEQQLRERTSCGIRGVSIRGRVFGSMDMVRAGIVRPSNIGGTTAVHRMSCAWPARESGCC